MQTANKKESFGEIINGSTPVLVDFSAEWCGPCRMMKPILQQLHQRMGEKIRIIKIDIDKSPAAAQTYNVQSVPTLIIFQNGKMLWRQSGVVQATQLEKIIEQHTTNN
ncbi:MAG: thioredoxin [Chitinophagaceae bacterium]|jgi:thioredoxin 1|nr:thioredoxin [Chitinophagaceae bacterium]MBP9099245.1 thioredoxin [Ferruginibacter sp.]MBL0305888.1 thioredoxin [Chitinophagaceae bacterium]HQV61246.1 thioredoxin [Chitinophagaceae bacterium]HQV87132.1 thioredoxin [Chitinophagaceae bacterium]